MRIERKGQICEIFRRQNSSKFDKNIKDSKEPSSFKLGNFKTNMATN